MSSAKPGVNLPTSYIPAPEVGDDILRSETNANRHSSGPDVLTPKELRDIFKDYDAITVRVRPKRFIEVIFPFNKRLNDAVRDIRGSYYEPTKKRWCVKYHGWQRILELAHDIQEAADIAYRSEFFEEAQFDHADRRFLIALKDTAPFEPGSCIRQDGKIFEITHVGKPFQTQHGMRRYVYVIDPDEIEDAPPLFEPDEVIPPHSDDRASGESDVSAVPPSATDATPEPDPPAHDDDNLHSSLLDDDRLEATGPVGAGEESPAHDSTPDVIYAHGPDSDLPYNTDFLGDQDDGSETPASVGASPSGETDVAVAEFDLRGSAPGSPSNEPNAGSLEPAIALEEEAETEEPEVPEY